MPSTGDIDMPQGFAERLLILAAHPRVVGVAHDAAALFVDVLGRFVRQLFMQTANDPEAIRFGHVARAGRNP